MGKFNEVGSEEDQIGHGKGLFTEEVVYHRHPWKVVMALSHEFRKHLDDILSCVGLF